MLLHNLTQNIKYLALTKGNNVSSHAKLFLTAHLVLKEEYVLD